MLIVYDSRTGNVERFVNKLNMTNVKICDDLIVNEPFILVTYVTGFGQVPKTTLDFLFNNHAHMLGVASSGNLNWGSSFAISADKIAQMYNVPIISKFELSGTLKDTQFFKQRVEEM